MMNTWKASFVATVAAGALVAFPLPAHAQHVGVADPAGDAFDRGLDITHAFFSNRDRAFVSTLRFTRDRPGDVIVLVRPRHGSAVRIVSRHLPSGPDKTFLVDASGRVPCRGLTSDWDRSAATVRLRMPARCLEDGNYGAVRDWALIEGSRGSGGDVDYAPEKPGGDIGITDWIPRG